MSLRQQLEDARQTIQQVLSESDHAKQTLTERQPQYGRGQPITPVVKLRDPGRVTDGSYTQLRESVASEHTQGTAHPDSTRFDQLVEAFTDVGLTPEMAHIAAAGRDGSVTTEPLTEAERSAAAHRSQLKEAFMDMGLDAAEADAAARGRG